MDREVAIELLKQEKGVSEDCISRKQAIEALTGWQTEPLDEDIVRTLNNLPPVTPTERTGAWIQNENGTYACSECQTWLPEEQYHYANYCLHCGAKMKGDTE